MTSLERAPCSKAATPPNPPPETGSQERNVWSMFRGVEIPKVSEIGGSTETLNQRSTNVRQKSVTRSNLMIAADFLVISFRVFSL